MAVMFQAVGNDTEVSGIQVYTDNVPADTCVRLATRGHMRDCVFDWNGGVNGEVLRFAGDVGRIDDCHVFTNGVGIVALAGADRNTVQDCYVDATFDGVNFAGNYCRVSGSSIISDSGSAVAYSAGFWGMIENNDLISNADDQPVVIGSPQYAYIGSNRIYGGEVGIDLQGGAWSTCVDNHIDTPDHQGIIADGLIYGNVSNNSIQQLGGTGFGIDLTDGYGHVIEGNHIIGTADGGILLTDCSQVTIGGNIIEQDSANEGIKIDWTSAGVGDAGAITITGNTVLFCEAPLLVVMTDTTDVYTGLVVTGNYFEGDQAVSTGGECLVEDAPGALITGNTFKTSGLGITDSKGCKVADNSFIESAATLPTGWTGMLMVDGCDGAQVNGNTHSGSELATGDGFIQLTGSLSDAFVHGNAYTGPIPGGTASFIDYGLIIDSGCNDVLVGLNDFRLATTALLDNGTGTVT